MQTPYGERAFRAAAAMTDRERRWRRIQRLWHNGRTQQEIAQRLTTDSASVGAEVARMRAAGWNMPTRTVRDPAAMAVRERRIAQLWELGETAETIAADLDLTQAAVRSQMRRMRRGGWPLERRRARFERPAPLSDRIAAMWTDGATIPQIAGELDLTTSHVAATLTQIRAGRKLARRHGDGRAQARHEQIAAMYRAGAPLAEIAQQAGGTARSVSATVSQLRASGWDLPRGR